MSTLNNNFKGVFTALITPFNKDGSIDYVALKDLVEWQISEGVQGLVPVGTTGESPTLTHSEHIKVIQTVVEQAKKRVLIIAGTGSNSTQEAIELTNQVIPLGIDASLQVAPYYNKPSDEGMYRHFIAIAEKAPIPQIIYNIPGRTSKSISHETLIKLLKHPLILGVKEATGNIVQSIKILDEDHTATVLSGDDNLALAIIAQGGHGVISVASNIVPKKMTSMIDLALKNNLTEARKQYYELLAIFQHLFIDTNPIPVKYIASKMNICKEIYRLPLCELSSEHKEKINALLKAHPLAYK